MCHQVNVITCFTSSISPRTFSILWLSGMALLGIAAPLLAPRLPGIAAPLLSLAPAPAHLSHAPASELCPAQVLYWCICLLSTVPNVRFISKATAVAATSE